MSAFVWIHAHVESMAETDDYLAVDRDEWESMTEKDQQDLVAEFGADTMTNAGGYGAAVVDEAEVPTEYRDEKS